jgi:hypothetical protein
MILGSGRPSVNVDGHSIFSGNVVVVVVPESSVNSDEVPLRRGILWFDRVSMPRAIRSARQVMVWIEKNASVAACVVSACKKLRLSEVAR